MFLCRLRGRGSNSTDAINRKQRPSLLWLLIAPRKRRPRFSEWHEAERTHAQTHTKSWASMEDQALFTYSTPWSSTCRRSEWKFSSSFMTATLRKWLQAFIILLERERTWMWDILTPEFRDIAAFLQNASCDSWTWKRNAVVLLHFLVKFRLEESCFLLIVWIWYFSGRTINNSCESEGNTEWIWCRETPRRFATYGDNKLCMNNWLWRGSFPSDRMPVRCREEFVSL